MNDWTDWEIIRRQVAIGGRVLDDRGRPVAGARIEILSAPEEFRDVAGGRIVDRTLSRSDGVYFFLDLPEGKYILKATDPLSGLENERHASVSSDKAMKIKMAQADFKLSG